MVGIDLEVEPDNDPQHLRYQQTPFELDLEHVADVITCAYFFPDIRYDDIAERRKKVANMVTRFAKALKPGGIAFLDEAVMASDDLFIKDLYAAILPIHSDFSDNYQLISTPHLPLENRYLTIAHKH